MDYKRVVVTGLGVVTPVGLSKDEFWHALTTGVTGIGPITRFDATAFPTRIAAEVKGFDPLMYMDRKAAKRTDRFAQFAVAAAKQALEDAAVDLEMIDRSRVGTFIGSGIGGMETMEEQHKILLEKGPGRISPFFVPMMISNMAAGQVAITFGLKGPALTVNTACATGTNAIGDAFR
ncbi:MAG: beta-ketoacyl synthase N-terminal-like domain-containing protein, partial [Bacillota bacterium]